MTFKMSPALFRISPGFAACASYANYSANMRLNESWFGCACDYKAMEASVEQASLYFRATMTVYSEKWPGLYSIISSQSIFLPSSLPGYRPKSI